MVGSKQQFRQPPHKKKCKLCENEHPFPEIKYRNTFAGWVCDYCMKLAIKDDIIDEADIKISIEEEVDTQRGREIIERALKIMDRVAQLAQNQIDSNIGRAINELDD